jgi:transcriptional regulator
MYLPPHFNGSANADQWLPRLLAHDPLVTLISQREGALEISHLPVVTEHQPDGRWTLMGHWARANPQWHGIEAQSVTAIVNGPHAYVSPRWYPEPRRSVPTWNYAVAHLTGRIELVTEPAALLELVDGLADQFESSTDKPWRRADGDPSLAGLAGFIVGFRLHVERVEINLKLNQHHPAEKVKGAVTGLRGTAQPVSHELATWMDLALQTREASSGP